ncbi:MAG: iron dependent repressor, metal binding and dimerization domain protein [Propionibacteriaceae bacterium]|nr:iron dependent repressor, metal binding and dimerization domain protein [Propionibacteriaceae bacterium]
MSDLIDTTEMYLRTIYELEEEGIVPLRARIAERLRQSGPTVSQTVARMERDGLLRVTGERHIELSPEGRERAVRVMRKHRLAERLLTDIIGVDWENVHDEACRWEHVISDDVEERLVVLLGDPIDSPYGNPIPEADDTGVPTGPGPRASLPHLVASGVFRVVIRRIGENLQTATDLLGELRRNDIVPGTSVVVVEVEDGYRLTTAAGSTVVDRESAEQLYAEASNGD